MAGADSESDSFKPHTESKGFTARIKESIKPQHSVIMWFLTNQSQLLTELDRIRKSNEAKLTSNWDFLLHLQYLDDVFKS